MGEGCMCWGQERESGLLIGLLRLDRMSLERAGIELGNLTRGRMRGKQMN